MTDEHAAAEPLRRSRTEAALIAVLLISATFVPLVVSQTGWDVFRVPKESLFEAAAIFAAALLAIFALYHGAAPFRRLWREQRTAIAVTFAAVAWTAIASAASTNRELSAHSFFWVCSCAVMFLATLLVAERPRRALFIVPIVPALVNAIVALLQRSGTSDVLRFDSRVDLHFRTAGLIGTPNELGVYLLVPTVIAAALAIASRGRARQLWTAATALLIAGIIASEALSAIAALTAAGATLVMLSVRRAKRALAIMAAIAIIVALAYAPLRTRALRTMSDVRDGHYLAATSYRIPAQLAALRMFADHPLTGVGPGCYGFWYMPYKVQLNRDHIEFLPFGENFGEAHNDHLQTLAVAGLPGYALFILALVVLGRRSLRRDGDEPRTFASIAALPLVVALAVVALAQFPLSLAAPMSVALHYAALIVAGAKPS
jgi:O-antigen ligase